MSVEERPQRTYNYLLLGWVVVPTLLLGILFILIFMKSGPGKGIPSPGDPSRQEENVLALARSTLGKQADLATCRTVIQQLNTHLRRALDHVVAVLSTGEVEKRRTQLALDKDDVQEMTATSFTPLDVYHLETCFLLRDAARSLELNPVENNDKKFRQEPIDRARAGFAWVCRQVRLFEPGQSSVSDEPAPPVAVLRRGQGSALERGLVFLALLEQFGLEDDSASLQGGLVFVRDDKGQERFWACAVVVGNELEAIYLFDPRMGLPVPGPQGKGIATLAQVRSDPSILKILKIDNIAYDITPEQAKTASVALVCPVSAVAPRMLLLQDKLLRDRTWNQLPLPSPVRIRLAEDPGQALASFQAARGVETRFWPKGAGLLSRFLPRDEGGRGETVSFDLQRLRGFAPPQISGKARLPRDRLFQFEAVPWAEFPRVFDDIDSQGEMGQRLRTMYAFPFVRPLVEAGTSRDITLRGQFVPAVRELVREQEQWQAMRRRAREATDLEPGIDNWRKRAFEAYAEFGRARGTADQPTAAARVEQVWKWKGGDAMDIVLGGAMAGPRGAEVMYQLALCRHEQATRHQARVDLAARAGIAAAGDIDNARKTWIDAEGYWKEFLDNNPGRPGLAAASRLLGEAQLMLGQKDEASKTWKDLSTSMTDLEKLARLWLAQQK
jgi:hypothetical protein